MLEKTLAIIKPDAVAEGHSGPIIALIELNKFTIIRMQKLHLTEQQAEHFYEVHKERPFFRELVDGMTKGPVVIMALIAVVNDISGRLNWPVGSMLFIGLLCT